MDGGENMKGHIKVRLEYSDWKTYQNFPELRYVDKEYEVYSYELGDGIWGRTYEDWDEGDYEELCKIFGQEKVNKVLEFEEDYVEGYVPFSFVEEQGYSILKKGKPIRISERDMFNLCTDSVVNMPDGPCLEPDAEGSPLREMGLI